MFTILPWKSLFGERKRLLHICHWRISFISNFELHSVILTFIWCLGNWHNTSNNYVEFFLYVIPVILCWEMNIKNVGITRRRRIVYYIHFLRNFWQEFVVIEKFCPQGLIEDSQSLSYRNCLIDCNFNSAHTTPDFPCLTKHEMILFLFFWTVHFK